MFNKISLCLKNKSFRPCFHTNKKPLNSFESSHSFRNCFYISRPMDILALVLGSGTGRGEYAERMYGMKSKHFSGDWYLICLGREWYQFMKWNPGQSSWAGGSKKNSHGTIHGSCVKEIEWMCTGEKCGWQPMATNFQYNLDMCQIRIPSHKYWSVKCGPFYSHTSIPRNRILWQAISYEFQIFGLYACVSFERI